MQETAESVKEYGVLVPALARPREDGGHELIAGHRRKHACELAGLATMPVIVRDIDRDAATIIMVDSNLQRENILPSERAKAYKMKMEAIKRQYAGIVDGTFTLPDKTKEINQELAEEVVSAEAKVEAPSIDHLNTELARVNRDLEHYTNHADKATAAFGGGLQHHLRDFSHHPTPVGLVCSILTQFTGNVYGTDVAGAFQCVPLNKDGLNLVGKSFPEEITFGAVNWFFHMVIC